jgi:hypothetical protein
MLTKNLHQLQTEVQRHVAADQARPGSYDTGFIGCLAEQSNSPEFIEREYGIPLAVSRIAESIFEGLPSDEAAVFFAAFPDAVESDGKDLTRVCWQFLAAELRSLPPVRPAIQVVINLVIDGMDLLAEGKEWPDEDAHAATGAANWAVDWAVDWAADSGASEAASQAAGNAGRAAGLAVARVAAISAAIAADWAASAAARVANVADMSAARLAIRRRQRDLLLRLVKEAPVTTTQENN